MNSPSRRRAWLPLAVFVVCVGGTLALAQPPGQRPGPPPGFGGPMGGMPLQPQGPNTGPPPGFGGPMGGMPQQPNNGQGAAPPENRTPPMGGMPNMPNMPNMGGMPNMPNMNMPGMNGGDMMQKVWICEKCKHQWDNTGSTPTKCPKCGVAFSHITDENGKVTRTTSGWLGSAKLWILLAVVGFSVIAAIVKGIMSASAGSGKKKVKKKRKPMRRPRDDDDDY